MHEMMLWGKKDKPTQCSLVALGSGVNKTTVFPEMTASEKSPTPGLHVRQSQLYQPLPDKLPVLLLGTPEPDTSPVFPSNL